jgi:Phage-related minor tail protein
VADAIVGALRVVLSADTAQFETALEGSARLLEKFGKNLGAVAAVAAAAFVAAGAAIAVSLKSTIDDIDKLAKTSEKIGVPVEELSALQHAANLADVEMSTLSTSMVRLSKNMVEAAGDIDSKAAKAFEALGIQVKNTDGTLKSTSTILSEVSQKFAGYEDSAEKTALAVALFGKAGAEMIPLLNQGATGLAAAAAEAKKFGLIVSTEAARAAQEFNDNLDRLAAINKGIWIKITSEALPALEGLSTALVAVASDSKTMEVAIGAIRTVITGLALVIVNVSAGFVQFVRDVQFTIDALKALGALDFEGFSAVLRTYQNETRLAGEQVGELNKHLLGLKSTILPLVDDWQQLTKVQDTQIKTAAPLLASTTAQKTALDSFIESTHKSIAAQQAEIAAFGQAAGVRERLRIVMQAEEIARTNNINLSKQQTAEIQLLGAQAEATAAKLATMNRIEEALPAWQKYQNEVQKTREEFQKAGKDLENFEEVQHLIAQKFGMTWEAQSAALAGNLGNAADALSKFGGNLKDWAKTAQILHAASALIATYAGSAQALAGPFPGNLIAAAAVLAQGLTLVAAIKSVGFAQGGSFRVGGGLTGIDSQMVAFKATPGEMVDVRRPGQGGGPPTTVNLMLPNPNEFFAVHIREMVDALNRAASDGYVIKVAR